MANPWLAIDVATAPAHRAREMRRAWERFVGDGPEQFSVRGESSLVREPIAASWRRSAAAGVDPSGFRVAPVVSLTTIRSPSSQVGALAAQDGCSCVIAGATTP